MMVTRLDHTHKYVVRVVPLGR
jgi:hypothetical protein